MLIKYADAQTMFHKHLLAVLLLLFAIPQFSFGQAPGGARRRPELIRDTDKAEGKDEVEAPKPKEFKLQAIFFRLRNAPVSASSG